MNSLARNPGQYLPTAFLSVPTYCLINRLNDISFNYDKILNIDLDPNKDHGHDGVSVKMFKI